MKGGSCVPGREGSIEEAMERALRPGKFIPYKGIFRFRRDLERVRDRIGKALRKGEAREAVRLFRVFLKRTYEKTREVDSLGGVLAEFFEDLFCAWVEARRAVGADPALTARFYLAWAERDPWAYFMDLHKGLVRVLDRPGFRAFTQLVREKVDSMPPGGGEDGPGYGRSHWVEVLKELFRAGGNAVGFLALCREEGMETEDFEVLAGIFESRGKPVEALGWLEKGLAFAAREGKGAGGEYRLQSLKKDLLVRLGRVREALALEWEDYKENPGPWAFADLMKLVPAEERGAWREKALAVGEKADLVWAVDLFLEQGEVERLAGRIRKGGVKALEERNRVLARRAAKALAKSHPDLSARLFRRLALSAVGRAGGSYKIALRDFERARDGFLAAGRAWEWKALVELVRRRHRYKRNLMPGFERIAAGGRAGEQGEGAGGKRGKP